MPFRSRVAVAVGLFIFALAGLGPVAPHARAATWVWPTTGRITQPYGCTGFSWERPYGNCAHFHRGIDIASKAWTKVRAASSGVVSYVGYNPYDACCDRAWIVRIRHDNGTEGWYAHMQPRRVAGAKAGDRVAAGQLIGYMGNTGRSTGVHLHFALMRGGAPVNPMKWLDGRPARTADGGGASTTGEGAGNPRPRATRPRPDLGPDAEPAVDGRPTAPARVVVFPARRYPQPI